MHTPYSNEYRRKLHRLIGFVVLCIVVHFPLTHHNTAHTGKQGNNRLANIARRMKIRIDEENRPDFDLQQEQSTEKGTRFTPTGSARIENGVTRQSGTVFSTRFLHRGDTPTTDSQEDTRTRLQRILEKEALTGQIPTLDETQSAARRLFAKITEGSGGTGRRR